jgi:hypothetical protein
LEVAKLLGNNNIPIACVGVSGCDQQLMGKMAALSGGMFVFASQVDQLMMFFLEQILLICFIIEFSEKLDQLLSQEILRQYMSDKLQVDLSTEEASCENSCCDPYEPYGCC